VAVQTPAGDAQLAAYVVGRDGAPADGAAMLLATVTAHLEGKLPAFMVPASMMAVDRIPLTRNGKTDTRALPPPTWEQEREDDFAEPRTPTEVEIAEVWRSVLGLERVGLQDNFFNLGGHSLLAARVVTTVRRRLAVELSVTALFQEPTLGGFAQAVSALRRVQEGDEPEPSATAASGAPTEPAPLSFTQRQLLYLDHLSPGDSVYNAALAMRVSGALDEALLRDALDGVYSRHEALRTVLTWDATAPRQTVLDRWQTELPVIDLRHVPGPAREAELQRHMKASGLAPFDLSADLMLRATLYRLDELEYVILFQPHHIAFDAWAVEILYRDLSELYNAARERRAPRLPELSLQYRDFARWQHAQLQGGALERDLDFWRSHLAGAPTILRLPTDRARPPAQSFAGATHRVALDPELTAALREACRIAQVTPYMLLLAVFATVLYRWSGQDDILLGGPMANRDHPGFEHLIGFFANTVLTRVALRGNPEFSELLARVKTSVLASIEHQHTPFELVVDAVRPERDPSANPLFQVNFRVRVGASPTLALAGTRSETAAVDLGIARFDLALELHVDDEQITAEFNYGSDLFEPATIEALARTFEATLAGAVQDPDRHLLDFDAPNGAHAPAGAARPAAGIRGFRSAR
jgi:acyl carrier protein